MLPSCRFGVDTFSEVRVAALSLGQRRRLLLAVAGAVAQRLLVLDEPTVGLDDAGVALDWLTGAFAFRSATLARGRLTAQTSLRA